MVGTGTQRHEQSSLESKRRELVTDALLSTRRGRVNDFAEPLEGGALIGGERGQVLIDGRDFARQFRGSRSEELKSPGVSGGSPRSECAVAKALD